MVASTSAPGVEAPAVRPITSWRETMSSGSGLSPSISSASAPAFRATSTRRWAFELLGEPLDGVLAVLCGVTDVIRPWTRERTEAFFQRVHRRAHVVERQRRLADHGDGPAVGLELGGRLRRLDDHRRLRALAMRTDHLDVVGVSDERDEMAAVRVAARLRMNLRDERTDGVHDTQAAFLAVLAHGRCNTVGGEDTDLTGRDLVLVVDEDGAQVLETTDDMVVVHDLVPDVDRRSVLGEQALDDLDCTVDPRAEGPGCCEQNAFAHGFVSTARGREGAEGETVRFPPSVSSAHAAISAARGVRRSLKKGAREGNMVSLTGASRRRATPAQKDRGAASRTRLLTRSPRVP